MFGLKKETVDDVLTVLAAVMIFNTLPQLQFVGQYFKDYPIIILAMAIIIIAYRNKIANSLGE